MKPFYRPDAGLEVMAGPNPPSPPGWHLSQWAINTLLHLLLLRLHFFIPFFLNYWFDSPSRFVACHNKKTKKKSVD